MCYDRYSFVAERKKMKNSAPAKDEDGSGGGKTKTRSVAKSCAEKLTLLATMHFARCWFFYLSFLTFHQYQEGRYALKV